MELKKQIRQRHLMQRSAMDAQEINYRSQAIAQKIINYLTGLDNFKQLGCYGYYPCRQEVSLLPVYERLLEQGIPLAFPKVHEQDMDFYQVISMKDFTPGAYGINEPKAECPRVSFEHAICFVPGLVFDKAGNRCGYGKGYYDRYFAGHLGIRRIAIAYDAQIEAAIPAENHDIPMQYLFSESGFLQIENQMEKGETV